ncbi:hypothetical protein [Leisingera sp. S232]|uniref:hypothetical protein n=1 Tax=Leisingera sp. S232 TaxID=3415132 RepID=UPI003C7A4F69
MAEKFRDSFWRRNNPVMWGVLATVAVVLFGTWAANQSVCQTDFWGNQSCGGSKWSTFLKAAPNEVGDTLAGFAGALAFVWLIATVWLQGQELAEQREELREQRVATQDMARAMAAQAKVFEDEQRARDEMRAKEELGALLENVVDRMTTFPLIEISWNVEISEEEKGFIDEMSWPLFFHERAHYGSETPQLIEVTEIDTFLKKVFFHLDLGFDGQDLRNEAGALPEDEWMELPLVDLVARLAEISDLSASLSVAQMQRVRNIRVLDTLSVIESFLAQRKWFQSTMGEEIA